MLICSLVAATNDYQKANKFRELYEIEQNKKEIELVRGGKRLSLSTEEVVVGDIVFLRSGMEIIGDGVVIEANAVEIDESSMTGESEPERKDILRRCMIEMEKLVDKAAIDTGHVVPSPILLSGTKVSRSLKVGVGRRRKIRRDKCGKELCNRQYKQPNRDEG